MNQPSATEDRLPPGPRWPSIAQTIAYLTRGRWLLHEMTRRYGTAFSLRLPGFGPTVVITDPALAKELFQQPANRLRATEPNLGHVLGPGSMFALAGEEHLRHRKLILPQFHGKRMRAYEGLIEKETLEEIASWPEGEEFPVLRPMMRITLNTILRAVFGADGREFDVLRAMVPRLITGGSWYALIPWLRQDLGAWSPWGRMVRMRKEFDDVLESLIVDAETDPTLEQRNDILSMMVQARYDDGTSMPHQEIIDELLTLLVAGHETTATSLAWAVERLRRHPGLLTRLTEEVDSGDSALLQATVHEVLRTRPVILGSGRLVAAPSITLGPWVIPQGHTVSVNIDLMHRNEAVYRNARAFNPDRFLEAQPDTYSWVPFGGGVRRCPGAAFANLEMMVVLRTMLRGFRLAPTDARGERRHTRGGVVFAPADGGRALVYRRSAGQ